MGSKPAQNRPAPPGRSAAKRAPRKSQGWVDPLRPQQPLASPRWILGGLLTVLALSAVCLYGAVCLLFWQGQWQLLFHPSPQAGELPPGLRGQDLRFDATETGVLRLHGWWIPAEPGGTYAAYTILLLPSGSGSLAAADDHLRVLHRAGANIFTFDYRGFGSSAKLHPSEKSVNEDAEAAWDYLTGTRHIGPRKIVLYGEGLGAAVAAKMALLHPSSPVVIFEDMQQPALVLFERNPSLKFLPVRLLFHDRFDPSPILAQLKTPKLFLTTSQSAARGQVAKYFDLAARPKAQASLSPSAPGVDYVATLSRFLAQWLASAPPSGHE